MDILARSALERLLSAGERLTAGKRSRNASLTKSDLAEYRDFTSLQKKEAFENTMRAARAEGAVELLWEGRKAEAGFIERVNLTDARRLAKFLGLILAVDQVADAESRLSVLESRFPVIPEIIQRWSELRKTRGLGPDSVSEWLDAARTIAFCQRDSAERVISLPIREASARLFSDSKRIEKLTGPLDVLLANSTESEIREPSAVWQELGLFREEHPARLAGSVTIERERVSALLDSPYTGFPANTVRRLVDVPDLLMTIENLTTFHSEARRRCNEHVLLIYTAGMPSPAWRAMYIRLLESLPTTVPVFHWGDIDEGGFRIAATLAQEARAVGHMIQSWAMHPDDVPADRRNKASPRTLERIRRYASAAGWDALGESVANAGFTVEQEGL
ncbi:MAG: hypothetical protein JWQ07_5158 [Ramlibacter sp.]|nr:hypothetical protein [Ramlibacter sp.]